MVEFSYNDTKNSSIGHILFKLKCKYHPCLLFEDDTNLYFNFCSVEELVKELRDLISICQQNLFCAQEQQK